MASALLTCVRQRFLGSGDTSGSWGPWGKNAARDLGDAAARLGGMTVKRFAEAERKQIDALKPPRVVRP